jgi:hypothetical protein
MTGDRKERLRLLQLAIEVHLEKIEKILGPNYTLTLIATHDGEGGKKDADLLLTLADRESVLRAIDRLFP